MRTVALVHLQPEMHGMVPVKARQFQDLQQDAVRWPNSLKQCAAVCNSLNLVNRQQVGGDVADYTAFRACEARFVVSQHGDVETIYIGTKLITWSRDGLWGFMYKRLVQVLF